MRSFPPGGPGPRAFTLLELLVSMAVLSVLLLIMLSVVDSATRLWRESENRVDAYREARAALNVISRDLESLYAEPGQVFFWTQEDPEAPEASDGTSDSGLDGRLFFAALLPPEMQRAGDDQSEFSTVGYFLAYSPTARVGGGKRSMNLYRYLRSSGATYDAFAAGSFLQGVSPISSAPTSDAVDLLAKNVTGFEVSAFSVDADAPNRLRKFVRSSDTPLPDVLEITLKAVSNDTAAKFDNSVSGWTSPPANVLNKDQRSFTTRIHLPKAAELKPSTSLP